MSARDSLLSRQCIGPGEADRAPPERITVMRFPYGSCNAGALAAVAEHGQLAIQWDIVTGDPDPHRSAKAIAATILNKVHPGAIIVAHANGRGQHTAEALALVIPKLRLRLCHGKRAAGGGNTRDRGQAVTSTGRAPGPAWRGSTVARAMKS